MRAANLIELAWPDMARSRQEAAFLGWLKALPDNLIRRRPVLSVGYSWALLAVGELETVEERLRDAESQLETTAEINERPVTSSDDCVVVDKEQFRSLPGSIAVYRTALAQARGDLSATIKYARQALDFVPASDHLRRGAAASLLGLAYWASGDLEAAHKTYSDGMASILLAGNISDAIGGSIALADIRIAQGRLRDAMRIYERGLQLATEHGEPAMRGTADMYVGMSEHYREKDDLHAAAQYLLKNNEFGEDTGFPQNRYRWRVAMARIREAQGDMDGALEMLNEAEHMYVSDFFPNVRPIAALKTRVWIAQGRLDEAHDWIREQGLSLNDDLYYLREFDHITLARVQLAKYKRGNINRSELEKVIGFLKRLLHAANEGERTASVIEILIVLALASQLQGDIPTALVWLERALALAEAKGYVRIFVDEGRPMSTLLEAAVKKEIALNYARQLLSKLAEYEKATPEKQHVIEHLSKRERDVLRLLGTDLSGPEIARELMVSLNTLRTHTKNIYDKLEVNNRRAAIRRAKELDLH